MSMAGAQAWQVREAGTGDVAALSLVAGATFLETFAGVLPGDAIVAHCANAYAAERFADYFAKGSRAWILEAAPGGAPVGFAQLATPDLPGAGPGDIELKRIYLLSRFHGSGAGAALMAAAVAGAAGHARLLLGVYAHNARALGFYRKQGFVPMGERRFDVGGQLFDDVVLARPLAG
ncbi:N-acetyltransferase family protein [Sphingomonas sp. NPDC092331]|jgi:ribosomal protein S18 acetylase RimI-like enzyme|uniref:GNAT family N-acetyltransferase n=2 Tax=Sphingomonas TaxID=13687 RepID=UPI0031F52550